MRRASDTGTAGLERTGIDADAGCHKNIRRRREYGGREYGGTEYGGTEYRG